MNEFELNENDFFTAEEVYLIMELVNEKIKQVIYHYWINNASNHKLEILDYIEFQFASGNKMFFSSGEESDGIKPFRAYDMDAKNDLLKDLHNNLIYIEQKNVSKHDIWKKCLGKDISPSFIKHDKKHLNDSLVLNFKDAHAVEIYLGLEGMEVDYFSE